MSDWVWFLIILGIVIAFIVTYFYFAVWRQPLLSAKGKIIRVFETKMIYFVEILFVDKNIIEFSVSKKQYTAVEKYDVVDITAKGREIVSIKKQGTQNIVIDEVFGLKEADLIHAKPMPLNNKDTRAYDKWVAKEKKEAEKKARR